MSRSLFDRCGDTPEEQHVGSPKVPKGNDMFKTVRHKSTEEVKRHKSPPLIWEKTPIKAQRFTWTHEAGVCDWLGKPNGNRFAWQFDLSPGALLNCSVTHIAASFRGGCGFVL